MERYIIANQMFCSLQNKDGDQESQQYQEHFNLNRTILWVSVLSFYSICSMQQDYDCVIRETTHYKVS